MAPPPKQEGPRANNQINVPDVRLIDAEGENVGVVATDRDGAFVFGTGTGLLVTAEIRDGRLTETHRSAASGFRGWDNHLLAA